MNPTPAPPHRLGGGDAAVGAVLEVLGALAAAYLLSYIPWRLLYRGKNTGR